MMYLDAHCHIEEETYGPEVDEVIARAFDVGLTHLIAVGATRVMEGAHEAVALAERLDAIYATAGVHPHDAGHCTDADVAQVEKYLDHPKVVALGEVGLDYYYDNSPRERQLEVFARFIAMARDKNVPLMLHIRDAHEDAWRLLDEVGAPEAGTVVHCFTAGPREAQEYLDRGMYLSIPGVVTFQGRSADPLREAVKMAPLDRLFIETDSPYLAPVPHRGKKNEPSFLVETAAAVGALRGLAGEDIGRITRRNAMEFYGLEETVDTALAYPIRNSLYLNITSHCTLGCVFCPKIQQRDWWVRGHWLKHAKDPQVQRVIDSMEEELQRRPQLDEVVFVGLGEPTLALDTLTTVARHVRSKYGDKYRLRVDTDGLGNLVHGRNVAAELAELVDALSVSLNAPDPATYAKLCPSKHGEAAYPAVKEFIVAAKNAGLEVTASAVGVPELDIEACRRIAEDELGVPFRHRVYQEYG